MKQDRQIDAVDRKIIAALQEDATLSHAELAERVGASSASCWRRIKALEAAGILAATVRLVDPEKVGRGVNVLCNIRMRSHAQEARRAFEQFVESRSEEHTSELQSLMRISYAVFCLQKKTHKTR